MANKSQHLLEQLKTVQQPNESSIEQELNESFQQTYNELSNIEITEEIELTQEQSKELNEALSVTLIISTILAAPQIIKGLAKAIGFIFKKIRKLFTGEEKDSQTIDKLIEMTDKWHHAYISVIKNILKGVGIFKKAGIEDKEKQEQAAEVVFYTIIFGFAVHGGFMSAKSLLKAAHNFSPNHISMATLESVLTSVKAKEIKDFIQELT